MRDLQKLINDKYPCFLDSIHGIDATRPILPYFYFKISYGYLLEKKQGENINWSEVFEIVKESYFKDYLNSKSLNFLEINDEINFLKSAPFLTIKQIE